MKNKSFILIHTFSLIIFSCAKLPELGDGYKITRNTMRDLAVVNYKNSLIINGHILAYAFDSTFVVAKQRPRDSVTECTGKIPGMTIKRCDEAFKKSSFRQFWILNKKEENIFDMLTKKYSNVYGPFKEEEYLKKREELGVPKDLQLKETNLD